MLDFPLEGMSYLSSWLDHAGQAQSHLDLRGTFVSTAGHVDNKGPFIRLQEHSCSLGTSGVVGSGAAAVRALHTAAGRLLHPLLTIVALLMEKNREKRKHSQPVRQPSAATATLLF